MRSSSVVKTKIARTREDVDEAALQRYRDEVERQRAEWFAHVAERNRLQQERRKQRQNNEASAGA